MEKESYVSPVMEIVEFKADDVIIASDSTGGIEGSETHIDLSSYSSSRKRRSLPNTKN